MRISLLVFFACLIQRCPTDAAVYLLNLSNSLSSYSDRPNSVNQRNLAEWNCLILPLLVSITTVVFRQMNLITMFLPLSSTVVFVLNQSNRTN